MSINEISLNKFVFAFIFLASTSCYAANVDSLLIEGTKLCKSFENLKALEKYKEAYA